MYIYKITNKINNKVYIGQSIHPIQERFNRHFQDALSYRTDTHLARAMRLYPREAFTIELLDDSATSQEELTELEHYWTQYYDAVHKGYNETDSIYKCGGNTYKYRSAEDMKITKEKLSQSKMGGKNPNARKIKCKNIFTQEELHFNSQAECRDYFHETNHIFISRRCLGKIKALYNKEWLFAFEENEYPTDYTVEKNIQRSKPCKVTNLVTKESKQFQSYAQAERYFNVPIKAFSGKASQKGKIFTYKQIYQIEKLY